MSEQEQLKIITLVKKNVFSLARYLYEIDNKKLYNLYVDFFFTNKYKI